MGIIIFLCILAMLFAWGMIGDKLPDRRRNYTIAFVVCVFAIVALSVFGA